MQRSNDDGIAFRTAATASLRRGHSDGDVLGPPPRRSVGDRRTGEETWMDFLEGSSRPEGSFGNPSLRHNIRTFGSQEPGRRQERQAAMQRAALIMADRKRRLTENQEDYDRRRSASSLPFSPAMTTSTSGFSPNHGRAFPLLDPRHPSSSSIMDRPLPPRPDVPPSRNQENREIILPRWQADSEVTRCPICSTNFGFWYRKHHCRKCGRVVCANCSPHRITIPRQFIVQPPQDTNRTAREGMPENIEVVDLTEDDDTPVGAPQPSTADRDTPQSPPFHMDPALGGGQEVRLCNPCVPDPNPLPHLPFESPDRIRSFPRPSFDRPQIPDNGSASQLPRRSSSTRHSSHQRGLLVPDSGNEPPGSVPGGREQDRHQDSMLPPPHLRHRHHASASNIPSSRYRRLSDTLYSPHSPRPLPPQRPQSQLREEDECPICHQALPPKGPGGSETPREAHVSECIEQHFSSSVPRAARPHPSVATEAAIVASTANTANTTPRQNGGSGNTQERRASESAMEASSSSSSNNAFQRMGSQRRRGVGMFKYSATEKDCIGEGGEPAECVICFEEFEQGVEMGRLECLCKFHKVGGEHHPPFPCTGMM
ncbi:MAG: hypothetical protein Q9186_006753 [Xanthomendoza sp. 1 TL-2023]